VPYSLALQGDALKKAQLPMPLPLLVTLQLIPQLIMFAIVIAIGLWLANRTGLGLPILEAKLRAESVGDKLRVIAPISIILGLLAARCVERLPGILLRRHR
jgi:hypothetical protein